MVDSPRARRTAASIAPSTFESFAVTAPGVAPITAEELRALGITADAVEPGGVAFTGSLEALYRANLWSRTASRVIVRVGEFHARAFGELERRAQQLPWERFIGAGRAVRLRVTCRKSRLYHSDAVAERIARVIESRTGLPAAIDTTAREPESGGEEAAGAQLVIVRIFHDVCTVSADSSGALLHMRGYRLATAKAPLRETLAAAVLAASGWVSDAPLIDPLCGAGTIPIEGALIARRIPPGLGRRFAFMQWPTFDAAVWQRTLDDARAGIAPSAPAPIQGSDRDAGAIDAATANAERAGVLGDIAFSAVALSRVTPPAALGWLVTNPPYGVRVGDVDRLRNLYAQLGNVARRVCAGWTLALLSADARLDAQLRMDLDVVLRTRNGGIPVHVARGIVPYGAVSARG
ncbi:MAG TPA: THUMP domain-containing protein [Gemmatimonadaceae bacterium]